MSDPEKGKREWRFYLDDMIAFAQKVQTYTAGLDPGRFRRRVTQLGRRRSLDHQNRRRMRQLHPLVLDDHLYHPTVRAHLVQKPWPRRTESSPNTRQQPPDEFERRNAPKKP
jgi:hypothetical protein